MIKKILTSVVATTILTTILMVSFTTYFFFKYSVSMKDRIYTEIEEVGEVDIYHLCNITECAGIYFNNKYYGLKENGRLSLQYTENAAFPPELFQYSNISLRTNLSFVIPIFPEGLSSPAYFFLNLSHYHGTYIFLYIILLIILNGFVIVTLVHMVLKERLMHNIEASKDKSDLQFNNLMFFIENLNHEVNSPLFVLSRKIIELEKKIDDQPTFKIIKSSIEQITAVMQRTREVKRINKITEDRNIYDLIESTIITIMVMRSEELQFKIDKSLENYILEQNLLNNGTFINILTNHIKNSIEAFSTNLTAALVEINKGKLTFIFADDGNGIPEKFRKRIFERGFSTKGSKSERGSGMSINKDIIESVGGHIKLVDSKVGTTFEITIPVRKK